MAKPTPRQRQALAGLLSGMPVDEIAATLRVAKKTIYRDLESARQALGAPTLATVLLAARDQGWITGSERLTPSGVMAIGIAALARGQRLRP